MLMLHIDIGAVGQVGRAVGYIRINQKTWGAGANAYVN